MSLLVPAPFEVRQQFLETRVAVFPDICLVFFGQFNRAVISGELQLACAPLASVPGGHDAQGPAGCQVAAFKGQKALPACRDLIVGGRVLAWAGVLASRAAHPSR